VNHQEESGAVSHLASRRSRCSFFSSNFDFSSIASLIALLASYKSAFLNSFCASFISFVHFSFLTATAAFKASTVAYFIYFLVFLSNLYFISLFLISIACD
jgi:hypothetical protein